MCKQTPHTTATTINTTVSGDHETGRVVPPRRGGWAPRANVVLNQSPAAWGPPPPPPQTAAAGGPPPLIFAAARTMVGVWRQAPAAVARARGAAALSRPRGGWRRSSRVFPRSGAERILDAPARARLRPPHRLRALPRHTPAMSAPILLPAASLALQSHLGTQCEEHSL